MARSEFGYRSLGAGSPNVTRAQHCRAEVYLVGYGWVPVDPADVRKVVLEEKPQPTTLADPLVPPVRAKLFGAWEMNWLAYNDAHDVKLPGSQGPAVGFLMYPQAETAKGRFDEPRPGQLQVHHHGARTEGLSARRLALLWLGLLAGHCVAQVAVVDSSGREIRPPPKVERVYAAGPPASLLVFAHRAGQARRLDARHARERSASSSPIATRSCPSSAVLPGAATRRTSKSCCRRSPT